MIVGSKKERHCSLLGETVLPTPNAFMVSMERNYHSLLPVEYWQFQICPSTCGIDPPQLHTVGQRCLAWWETYGLDFGSKRVVL